MRALAHRADLLQLLWRLWRLSQNAPPDKLRWSAMDLRHIVGHTLKHVGNPYTFLDPKTLDKERKTKSYLTSNSIQEVLGETMGQYPLQH